MAKKRVVKTKVVKAKVSKAKQKKRMSKGADHPWEVWCIGPEGYHQHSEQFKTESEAEAFITDQDDAPIILHIDIPAMEY